MPEPPVSLWPDPAALGPVTDLYQLTMMAGYAATGMDSAQATFEVFVRRLPKGRAFLVFAGLEQAIGDLLRLAFSPEQVELIRRLPAFAGVDPAWFDRLGDLRFEGDVWAVPEGTVVFAGEPIVRIEAALPQAQWVETFLIASLGYPTLVASKAARIVEAAAGRPCYDFGARRGHGPHAGMLCARASYLAGFAGTSQVEAAIRMGIPCVGTMAHSWVQAFADEPGAFEAFSRAFPGSTLLVDTYDTPGGSGMPPRSSRRSARSAWTAATSAARRRRPARSSTRPAGPVSRSWPAATSKNIRSATCSPPGLHWTASGWGRS